jgi:hypothetical protein
MKTKNNKIKKMEFTANDVDGAYFLGVFNSVGIDGLGKEIERIKKLKLLPSQTISILKNHATKII